MHAMQCLALAFVLLISLQTANADCCHAGTSKFGNSICGDCSHPTPYCGYGKCNIFGCACDGGCRKGKCNRIKRSSSMEGAEFIVSAGDLNGDGFLSIEEAETMLEQGPNAAHRRSVRSLDKNMDGMLSVDEIDN